MFESFLDDKAEDKVKSVPFLSRLQIFNDQIMLFADASGNPSLGMGLQFQGEWRQGLWHDTTLFSDDFRPNIALLELLAIVAAVETWAHHLSGKRIILRSDNAATVVFLNKMRVDIPAAMLLLRKVSKTCLKFQIWLRADHIRGKNNIDCDLISRDRLDLFFKQNPTVAREKITLPQSIWPPTWTKRQMMTYPSF